MRKLQRKTTKNILMSTIGSDQLGCYNDKQDVCVYYSQSTKSFCAIGMLMSEIDDKFESNNERHLNCNKEIEGFDLNGETVNGGLDIEDNTVLLNALSEHTGLTNKELEKLQLLHDASVSMSGPSAMYKKNLLKYETFVAGL